jgi:hypothetical protein
MWKHSLVAVFMRLNQINNPKRVAFFTKDATVKTCTDVEYTNCAYHIISLWLRLKAALVYDALLLGILHVTPCRHNRKKSDRLNYSRNMIISLSIAWSGRFVLSNVLIWRFLESVFKRTISQRQIRQGVHDLHGFEAQGDDVFEQVDDVARVLFV